jgi:hypothetical protein
LKAKQTITEIADHWAGAAATSAANSARVVASVAIAAKKPELRRLSGHSEAVMAAV